VGSDGFDRNVFVNCPFDADYEPILQAILFCIVRFGLRPRIATERANAGEARLDKIVELIDSSRYSIHDLSRCQARQAGEYYRLNMPFELGLDFGCRRFGASRHAGKAILVLEEQPYRYQAALSDIAGSDIQYHGGNYATALRKVRNWITGLGGFESIGAARILTDYEDFQEWHLERQISAGFSADDIRDYETAELLTAMIEWHDQGRPKD
jgi:hypothetical protein